MTLNGIASNRESSGGFEMRYATLEARRDARYDVSHPGKFELEDAMVPILYAMRMDGSYDEECGSDDEGGTTFRIGKWIVFESDQGFVYGTKFPTSSAASNEFSSLEEKLNERYEDDETDE
jgi:hypothetical protein